MPNAKVAGYWSVSTKKGRGLTKQTAAGNFTVPDAIRTHGLSLRRQIKASGLSIL